MPKPKQLHSADDPATFAQRSVEWREARLGKITASRFADILTQPRGKADRENGVLSQTAKSYMLDVVAEILTGQDQGPRITLAMQWGIDCEPAACDVYAERIGLELREVGFLPHPDEPIIGGSPDRLVGDDGGLEVKCPFNTRIHLGYALDGVVPKEHLPQVQGLMWITGRQWWDFVTYDPRIDSLELAMLRIRVERDESEIQRLAEAVFAFRDRLLETLCKLKGDQS